MKRLAKCFLWLIKARYQLQLKNFPKLDPKCNYLILPNHIAYLDPVLIWSLFAKQRQLKTVATARFSQHKFLKRIFRKIGTISIAESSSETSDQQLKQALNELMTSLKNGESVLLYPSGQLAWQGLEYLGGKKSAYLATKNLPAKSRILLIRTRGLRGSMRSNAWNGQSPDLLRGILKGFRYLLANLFFFLPKRKVEIEFSDQTDILKLASQGSLEKFNQTLEAFYNAKGEEKLRYIPHYCYYNDVKDKQLPEQIKNSLKSLQQVKHYQLSDFPSELVEAIFSEIKRIKNLPEQTELSLEKNLILDLYLDSLDMAELKNLILNHYPQASNTPILELKTVADLVAMARGKSIDEGLDFPLCERNLAPDSAKEQRNINEKLNILENFKCQRAHDKNATQSYDVLFGMQSRKAIALKAFLISDYLKQIPGKQIGIMLPSIGSVGILLLASYLAEKIPVMMNRTHPETAFAHCVKFSKTEKILTSKTFFNKINISRLKKYDFIFLEDLIKDIPWHRKLKALVKSRYFPIPKQLDKTAVVLYTSGSEALPKAVPLTHQNVISNLIGALQIMHIQHDERFFCYLPPFHSFGFTVNTVFPLVAGLRSISTPDPNDALTVAKLIAHSKPTLLATTPTFLRNLLNIASSAQLSSLRYVITGGEKCSEQIFKKFKNLIPTAKILEGYGITECSPIISINPIEKQKPQSVGIALGNGKLKIFDLESDQVLKAHQEGMICYCWPNVFSGYQDSSLESPFLEKEGECRYKTWDLGYLDKDGYLYITGRKKRFLKLGGEMISLPFLEALLQEKRGSSEEAILALEWKETETWIQITLFIVDKELTLKEVNDYLRKKGVSNLIQIDVIKKIGAIPLLWTWKIDYKVLKELL